MNPATEQALAALQASRERLAVAMRAGDESEPSAAAPDWWRRTRRTLRVMSRVFAADLSLEALPLLLRRHPLAAALGAVALGAGLVALRPWRWGIWRETASLMRLQANRWLVDQVLAVVLATLTARGTAAPAPEAPKPPEQAGG